MPMKWTPPAAPQLLASLRQLRKVLLDQADATERRALAIARSGSAMMGQAPQAPATEPSIPDSPSIDRIDVRHARPATARDGGK